MDLKKGRLEHIKTLEKIKKRVLKRCGNNSTLKWDTLTDRRTRIRLCAKFETYRAAMRAIQPSSSFVTISLQRDVIDVHRSDEIRNTLYAFRTDGSRDVEQRSQTVKRLILFPTVAELKRQSARCSSVLYAVCLSALAAGMDMERRFNSYLASDWDEGDNVGEMSPGSSTESYPAFAHIGLRENSGKNLNQVTGFAVRRANRYSTDVDTKILLKDENLNKMQILLHRVKISAP
ncbi:hypothetical protein ANN_05201 [Periplaneta americana]|uniref:Uncharacterized protein n=1 Tax=Periplaneta americana TaxID=6978 RepID=A0ABQ8TAK5_PERAM|nr:hypothetical protein ANN_05201 [Periplaneta americana]